jgi:hypothetical protein
MSGNARATCCRPTRSARKKHRIRHRIRTLRRRSDRLVVLAEDETDLRLFPPLRAGWAPRGKPAPVPISGGNAKRVLFGTVNIVSGHRLFVARHRQRGVDFGVLLALARQRYAGWDLAMLLDEDTSHTAVASIDLARRLDIELLWLPKRSPHLNPMDHLWRHGKEVISANWQYANIDTLVETFVAYLSELSATETLRKAGLQSSNFWLHE